MTTPGTHPTGHRGLPEPPYSADLLADLDAGVLPDDVAAHVRARAESDPAARATLTALHRTRADLGAWPVTSAPVPETVAARTEHTLAAIAAEVGERGGEAGGRVTALAPAPQRRPTRRSTGWVLAGAAAVLAVIAVAVALTVWRPATTGEPVQAQPSRSAAPGTLAPSDTVAVLSVLGRLDAAPFPSMAALRACTDANDVPERTAVLGSGPITVDGGDDAVVILLATGTAGKFDALVVRPDCGAGNPATISRTVIGR